MTRATRGILTKTDIGFLKSEDYYDGENARQMRYQRRSDIRSRIVSSISDFNIIRGYLSSEERDKIFAEPENNGAESQMEFEEALDALIGFIYLGCRSESNDLDFERIFEPAIIRAEEEYHRKYRDRPVDISVDIDIDVVGQYTKISELARMLEEGEPVHIENIYKLPRFEKVPINPDKVDIVKVKTPSHPKRQQHEKRMVESILLEHLGIDAEVEMKGTQAHITDEDSDFDLVPDPTAVVPPEDFESR